MKWKVIERARSFFKNRLFKLNIWSKIFFLLQNKYTLYFIKNCGNVFLSKIRVLKNWLTFAVFRKIFRIIDTWRIRFFHSPIIKRINDNNKKKRDKIYRSLSRFELKLKNSSSIEKKGEGSSWIHRKNTKNGQVYLSFHSLLLFFFFLFLDKSAIFCIRKLPAR